MGHYAQPHPPARAQRGRVSAKLRIRQASAATSIRSFSIAYDPLGLVELFPDVVLATYGRGAGLRARPDQLMVIPPSTLRMWPVMNEAASDAMKTIASACSSDTPRRAIGTCVTRAALFSSV